jgi:pSer/pThr/pTyr-binding forkhead associated (FHA) protein
MRQTITVRLMSGPQDGLAIVLDLPGGSAAVTFTIGRSEECDVSLAYDTQVSRTHAELICTVDDETVSDVDHLGPVQFQLADVGSRNGTYLGERRLRDEAVPLERGQLFRVGRTWLRVDG